MSQTTHITATDPAADSLAVEVGYFARIIDAIDQCVLGIDRAGRVVLANNAARAALGLEPTGSLDGVQPWDDRASALLVERAIPTAQQSGRWEGELTLQMPEAGPLHRRASVVADAESRTFALLFGPDEPAVGSAFDATTGLPTLPTFLDHLGVALSSADAERPVSVLLVGIERLRQLTYSLGHDAVDELLVELAGRVSGVLRRHDLLARIEFDTLAIACLGADGQTIDRIADRVRNVVEAPHVANGRDISVRVSVGVAVSIGEDTSGEDLVRDADVARTEASRLGGSRVERFVDSLRSRVSQRTETENDLLVAIEERQFVLHYQPEVNLRTGDVLGFEALIRWEHPTKGLLLPGAFVGIAEGNGMIVKMGLRVLEEACRQSLIWARLRPEDPPFIAVNVSPRQLAVPSIVDDLMTVVTDVGAEPRSIQLEITESVLVDHPDLVLERIAALHELGFKIAIDDFGSGYSSLGYLKAFTVDVLKIDRTLVMNIATDAKDWAIVNGVLGMAQAMGLTVVGEGIEDGEQAGALRILGCDVAQGWYFARAAPAEQLADMLTSPPKWKLISPKR